MLRKLSNDLPLYIQYEGISCRSSFNRNVQIFFTGNIIFKNRTHVLAQSLIFIAKSKNFILCLCIITYLIHFTFELIFWYFRQPAYNFHELQVTFSMLLRGIHFYEIRTKPPTKYGSLQLTQQVERKPLQLKIMYHHSIASSLKFSGPFKLFNFNKDTKP